MLATIEGIFRYPCDFKAYLVSASVCNHLLLSPECWSGPVEDCSPTVSAALRF
jgi:hypothetical protein